MQPNENKKCYCALPKNCAHLTFLKKSCSLGQGFSTFFDVAAHFSPRLWFWAHFTKNLFQNSWLGAIIALSQNISWPTWRNFAAHQWATTHRLRSTGLGLVRWFATKLHNSKSFWSICMKFSGLASLHMKNICGKFRCKQTSTRKVIALAFVHVNPHPVYSIEWRIYASFPNLCIWTTHTCVIQQQRC